MKGRCLALSVFIAAGCNAQTTADGTAADLPVLELSSPVVEIGVLDGPSEYIFASIVDVVRLPGGRIAVSDAGTGKVSVYDASGQFVRSWGGEGDGPGEFRSLSRLYPMADSLLAVDQRTNRVSLFDPEGRFVRQLHAIDLSEDSTFALDSWLYGRFWVDGALRPEARRRVKSILDRWPQPRLTPGYRAVRVARNGDLWVREPVRAGSRGLTSWTWTDSKGIPIAIVETPSNFHPRDILENEILGVWIGESDVHFVRTYALVESGRTGPVPAWLLGEEAQIPAGTETDEDAARDLMRQSIRMIASAQEIHYSTAYTYTTAIDSLTAFEQPAGLDIDFAFANARGWAAVFTLPGYDRVCALAYGFGIPPGWRPGMILCAPAVEPRADGVD